MPGDVQESGVKSDTTGHDSHGLDIRGLALLPRVEFWQLFLLLGLLTGIGLMTIKSADPVVIVQNFTLTLCLAILGTMSVNVTHDLLSVANVTT